MKKLIAFLLVAAAVTGAWAQTSGEFRLPGGYDPLNLNYSFSPGELKPLTTNQLPPHYL